MRLLFVDFSLPYLLADDEFPIGGFAVQLEQWLYGLAEAGVETGVLTWKGANARAPGGYPFKLLETFDPDRGIRILKYFYSYIPSMLGAARAFRPDAIVQSVASVHTGIMAFIAARLGVPFIYRIACDSDVNETRKTLLLPYERISYAYGLKSAELVICQNGYQVAQMDRLWPGKRLLRVANTIRAPHEPQQLHGRAKRSYVAWLGIFREQKNLPLLLRAAKALPEVEFRVAGMPCKSTTDEIRGVLNELSKLQNVRIMGYLRRVSIPEFLGRATALLCTSDFEGFSNAFLEAFAAGTPVLTREGVDPDSIIQRHALGYVARSEQDLIADVDRLSRLPAEDFDLLAANCRAYVEAHHAPRRAMTEVAEAVRSLIESRRSSSQTINRGSGEG